VQPPQPELPDVCIAVIAESTITPEEWISQASRIPGVVSAEQDQLRWSF
jgi:hypothetical protein